MDINDIKSVLVVGSGMMGSSIAQLFVMGEIDVTLVDVEQAALERALGRMQSGLETLADLGKIEKTKIATILERVSLSTDLEDAAKNVDFAMEVVPEVPAIKEKVFSQLEAFCSKDTIIASNTSGLDIFKLVDFKRPERVVIAHFFAPAHIIPLVEIVPGAKTSAEVVSLTENIMKKLGKSPVVMKGFGPGFIVNRIQKAIGETSLEMIEEGLAGPAEIDLAMKLSLGVRLPIIGVVQTLDFQGLDMLLDAMKHYGKVYSFVEDKVKEGHLGAKTSKGIYDYGGRSEAEILRKRDALFLKMLDYLKEINAFEPV
jgi:3-hydroxybutyryl-CoA dehydrogenase